VKAVPFEINLNGHANHWIVVDNENAWHAGSSSLDMWFRRF
jgi:hypothetical protein